MFCSPDAREPVGCTVRYNFVEVEIMQCVHDKIAAALDRWQESHWFLHQVEAHYHEADTLRYSMNAFIRSVQEVPNLVTVALQNEPGFVAWHKPVKAALTKQGDLFSHIILHRNYIVHKSMMVPKSKAYMAAIRGYTVKMAFPFHVDPFDDSDEVVSRFVRMVPSNPILLGILAPDEVQQLAVIREWHLSDIDDELIQAFRNAWLRVGKYLSDVLVFLGGDTLPDTLPDCFHDHRDHQYRRYPQVDLNKLYEAAQQGGQPNTISWHQSR